MIVRDSAAVVSDGLQAFTRMLDLHANPGELHIFSAPMPAAVGGSTAGCDLLAVFVLPKPSLSSVTAGVLTLNDIDTTMVLVTGDAAWGRFYNGAMQTVTDVDVGVTGGGAAVTIDGASPTLYAGGLATVLSVTRGLV